MPQTQAHLPTQRQTEPLQRPHTPHGKRHGQPRTEQQAITPLNSQKQVLESHTQTINMFKMFAIMCAVTVMECTTHYEDPPRTFNTEAECQEALVIKQEETVKMLSDEDGYLTVAHLELGCTNVYN
jgi:hypothetical protein